MRMDIGDEMCIDFVEEDPCKGPIEFHSVDPGRTQAWPRCEKHWAKRLARRENSMEKYENSDVVPSWFDPTFAGERWEEDY